MVQVIKIKRNPTRLERMFRYTELVAHKAGIQVSIKMVDTIEEKGNFTVLGRYIWDERIILIKKPFAYEGGTNLDCMAVDEWILHELVHACQRQTGKSLFELWPECPRTDKIYASHNIMAEWEAYSFQAAYIYRHGSENYKDWLNKLVNLYS